MKVTITNSAPIFKSQPLTDIIYYINEGSLEYNLDVSDQENNIITATYEE
jgi:hypothetical protein